jgi:hypothetical protein
VGRVSGSRRGGEGLRGASEGKTLKEEDADRGGGGLRWDGGSGGRIDREWAELVDRRLNENH